MCNTIHYQGQEIETPQQLNTALDVHFYLAPGHRNLEPDACLCQIDIDKTLEQAGLEYRRDGLDYFIVDTLPAPAGK